MLQKPTFRSTWLPLGLAALALVVLNAGLYTRLAAQPGAAPYLSLPYSDDYSSDDLGLYNPFSGDWEIKDQSLVQLDATGYDLGTSLPLNIPADQPYFFEVQMRRMGGANGGGLLFNAQQVGDRQQSQMARFNVDDHQLWLIYGYFDSDRNFVGQGSVPLTIPPENTDPHILRVEVNRYTYTLLLDGQVVADNVPLQYHGGSVGLMTVQAQVAFDNLLADALSAPSPGTGPDSTTTLFVDTFQSGADPNSAWTPFSGMWQYEPAALVQTEADGSDFGAGYRQSVTAPYVLRVTFRHRSGAGGGVLFNMPQPDSKKGASIARYFPNNNVVSWGYFDQNGAFQGQGSAGVPPPGTALHTLEIRVRTGDYSVSLDGVSLAQAVPLTDTAGPKYIGLTSSLSAVAFQRVSVFSSASEANTPEPSGGIDVQEATGAWTAVQGIITQNARYPTDFFAGMGAQAQTFSLSVDILLPVGSANVGGGLIFDMAGRDDPRGSTMMRLGNGGRLIFWGKYDDNGVFQGIGNKPLSLSPGDWATLKLDVRADSFDISVNGSSVAQAVPRSSHTGWIGLMSFSGPVQFSNVHLTSGGA